MRRRTRDDWRREVLRSKRVSDSTRVLLLYLADHMRADLQVSVPRSQIAEALGRNERRIAERFTAARDAGLLDSIAAGKPGRTAVYIGTFPDLSKGADSSTHKGADGRTIHMSNVTRMPGNKGADGGPAITRADLTAVGRGRNVGSEGQPWGRWAA